MLIGTPVVVSTPHVTYEPWTDGYAVGYKVTHRATGAVEYVYLNPSNEGVEDRPDVFLYHGNNADPARDAALLFVNVHEQN